MKSENTPHNQAREVKTDDLKKLFRYGAHKMRVSQKQIEGHLKASKTALGGRHFLNTDPDVGIPHQDVAMLMQNLSSAADTFQELADNPDFAVALWASHNLDEGSYRIYATELAPEDPQEVLIHAANEDQQL